MYRLRITASDHADNGAERARSMEITSEPVRLDSSAPRFDLQLRRESGRKLSVRGRIADAGGGIVEKLERRDSEGNWLPVAAADGLMDRSEFELDLVLPLPDDDPSVFEMRAADEFGNWSYFRQEIGSER
jgi:hypothetical protein